MSTDEPPLTGKPSARFQEVIVRWLFGYDVFISYRWQPEVQAFVQEVVKRLDELGLDCFIDERSIEPGESLPNAIGRGVARSRVFIIFVNESVRESKWMPQELARAVDAKRTILPVDVQGAIAHLTAPDVWTSDLPQWNEWPVLLNQKYLSVSDLAPDETKVADLAGQVLQGIGSRTAKTRATRVFLSISFGVAAVVLTASLWALSATNNALNTREEARIETDLQQTLTRLAKNGAKRADALRATAVSAALRAGQDKSEAEKDARTARGVQRAAERFARGSVWQGRASVASGNLQHHVAEYALARAVEEDPASTDKVMASYRHARSQRWLEPLTQIPIGIRERLIHLGSYGGVPVIVLKSETEQLRLHYKGKQMAISSPGEGTRMVTLVARGNRLVWTRGSALFLFTVGQSKAKRVALDFEPEDVELNGGEVLLLEREEEGAWLHRRKLGDLSVIAKIPLLEAPESGEFELTPSPNASVCALRLVNGEAQLYRWSRSGVLNKGSFSAPELPRLATALELRATPTADRYLATLAIPSDGQGFLSPSKTAWLQLDLNDPRQVRMLTANFERIELAPTRSGVYLLGRTRENVVQIIPEVSPVVTEASTLTIARQSRAACLLPWTSSQRGHMMLAVGDNEGVTIYDHDRALARYRSDALEPISTMASEDGEYLALDARHKVVIWCRARSLGPVSQIPPSASLASLLKGSELDAVSIASSGAPTVSRP